MAGASTLIISNSVNYLGRGGAASRALGHYGSITECRGLLDIYTLLDIISTPADDNPRYLLLQHSRPSASSLPPVMMAAVAALGGRLSH